MMKILLTTDLSQESLRSFGPVGELARRTEAKILLFYVVPDPVVIATGMQAEVAPQPRDFEEMETDALRRLGEIRKVLPAEVEVEIETVQGTNVGRAIVERGEREEVDLIAMTTHGRSGVSRLLMGSVAEAVLRGTTRPMFLYPRQS